MLSVSNPCSIRCNFLRYREAVFINDHDRGCIANTRPVTTIKKWATGGVMQRQVLVRSVSMVRPVSDCSLLCCHAHLKGCVCCLMFSRLNAMYESTVCDYFRLMLFLVLLLLFSYVIQCFWECDWCCVELDGSVLSVLAACRFQGCEWE